MYINEKRPGKTKISGDEVENTSCVLPWIHIAMNTDGSIRPCCISTFSSHYEADISPVQVPNIYSQTFDEIQNSKLLNSIREEMEQGQRPSSCRVCYEAEERMLHSKRRQENLKWKNQKQTLYLDLRFGSLCNLACVMCSMVESSKWSAETQYYEDKADSVILKTYFNEKKRNAPEAVPNEAQFQFLLGQLKDNILSIKEIYFAGGEPLLQKAHDRCLDVLIQSGRSSDIRLCYNTNGTVLNESHFEKWENFNAVQINLSIDAINERNNFIRFPSNWNELQDKFVLLEKSSPRVSVRLTTTVSSLNVLYLNELVDWKVENHFQKIQTEFSSGDVDFNLVYFPSFLSIQALPKHLKLEAEKRLSTLAKNSKISEQVKKRIEGMIKFMNEREVHEEDGHAILLEYLNLLKQKRGLDSTQIFPDLYG